MVSRETAKTSIRGSNPTWKPLLATITSNYEIVTSRPNANDIGLKLKFQFLTLFSHIYFGRPHDVAWKSYSDVAFWRCRGSWEASTESRCGNVTFQRHPDLNRMLWQRHSDVKLFAGQTSQSETPTPSPPQGPSSRNHQGLTGLSCCPRVLHPGLTGQRIPLNCFIPRLAQTIPRDPGILWARPFYTLGCNID